MLYLLVFLTIAAISSTVAYPSDLNSDNERQNLKEQPREIIQSVSLDDFSVLNKLGNGSYATVYLAKKNGGLDDGKLYAMKVVNLTFTIEMENIVFFEDILIKERRILEVINELPCVSTLHYAFRAGSSMFYVIDLATGGDLYSRVFPDRPDLATMKIALAEIVCAIEALHKADILHGDISFKNTLIASDGHLVLTDFGFSDDLSGYKLFNPDWKGLCYMCSAAFPEVVRDENVDSLIGLLRIMTTEQLPQLKSHPFFDGIDWTLVAERRNDPPFESNEIEINENASLINLIALHGIDEANEMETDLDERFRNYSYVAPQHRF